MNINMNMKKVMFAKKIFCILTCANRSKLFLGKWLGGVKKRKFAYSHVYKAFLRFYSPVLKALFFFLQKVLNMGGWVW